MKNIFRKTATKKNEQSAVTKEPPQGWCKNELQKKIYILKKYILQKTAAYKYTEAKNCKWKVGSKS
ncbi:MAG: hypothetical protein HY015_00650 [Bacteroidetes bacterium]|nr:hypothetical protein [Bacteroidota bacterium]MBI3481487.1 hypothetical protein [Bacteroidota bacterium]